MPNIQQKFPQGNLSNAMSILTSFRNVTNQLQTTHFLLSQRGLTGLTQKSNKVSRLQGPSCLLVAIF